LGSMLMVMLMLMLGVPGRSSLLLISGKECEQILPRLVTRECQRMKSGGKGVPVAGANVSEVSVGGGSRQEQVRVQVERVMDCTAASDQMRGGSVLERTVGEEVKGKRSEGNDEVGGCSARSLRW
jgi:hypothetical protein